MAVATPTHLGNATATDSLTATSGSITLATGDLLIVAAGATDSAGLSGTSISGVTWNGIGLTQAVQRNGSDPEGDRARASLWYLHVASGATATFTVTCTINSGAATPDRLQAIAFKTTGHDSASPIGDTDSTSVDTNFGGNSTVTLTLDSASGDLVVDCHATENFSNALTPGAGQTEISEVTSGNHGLVASYEAATGAATTMSYTRGFDVYGAYVAVVIKAAPGGGGGGSSDTQRIGEGLNRGIARGIF